VQEYQAVVRVRHGGVDLAANDEALNAVTGELLDYGPTAQLWPDLSEWTLTVRVPSLWDVAAYAGRAVRAACEKAGLNAAVVRVDAWNLEEWDAENGVSEA
jgi:hypothetical protein